MRLAGFGRPDGDGDADGEDSVFLNVTEDLAWKAMDKLDHCKVRYHPYLFVNALEYFVVVSNFAEISLFFSDYAIDLLIEVTRYIATISP